MLLGAVGLRAQACPEHDGNGFAEAAMASTLHGTLQVHNDLRHWLGLKLDATVCKKDEVQLIFSKSASRREAETMRGCTVTGTGKLFESPTAYYSEELAVADAELKPDPSCHRTPAEPDPSTISIPGTLKSYRASINVDYQGKGHVEVRVWPGKSESVQLKPWQTYVRYTLTGGQDVIWFNCQKDFSIKDITQTPGNEHEIIRDEPFLTGAVLQDTSGKNLITFACERKADTASAKRKVAQPKSK